MAQLKDQILFPNGSLNAFKPLLTVVTSITNMLFRHNQVWLLLKNITFKLLK